MRNGTVIPDVYVVKQKLIPVFVNPAGLFCGASGMVPQIADLRMSAKKRREIENFPTN
jgi:hypothetical protein